MPASINNVVESKKPDQPNAQVEQVGEESSGVSNSSNSSNQHPLKTASMRQMANKTNEAAWLPQQNLTVPIDLTTNSTMADGTVNTNSGALDKTKALSATTHQNGSNTVGSIDLFNNSNSN